MPSALLAAHLPADLARSEDDAARVPRLMEIEAENDAARLEAWYPVQYSKYRLAFFYFVLAQRGMTRRM